MNNFLISLMILFPILSAMAQVGLMGNGKNLSTLFLSRWVAIGGSLLSSLIAISLIFGMQPHVSGMQISETQSWVGSYAISYSLGIDGLSVPMVLLIAIIFPVLLASEWNRKNGVRGMHGLLLILQSALLGAVCAQDLFLQFFFWMLSALPFYFLIGIWGGKKRESAAFQTVVASSFGNALFFTALLIVYYSVDPHTFSIAELSSGILEARTLEIFSTEVSVSKAAFVLLALGLALRTPIWPLHGWFTRMAEEAPASVVVAYVGAIVPTAIYIFTRLAYTLFPQTILSVSGGLILVGLMNLLIGMISATAQKNLRLLLAFLCLGEVGFLLMGLGSLNAAGSVGAVYQLLAFGLSITGFGLFAGVMIDRLGHSDFINADGETNLGGIALKAPALAIVVGVLMASILGFPGLGGFVGHSLLVIGSYTTGPLYILAPIFAALLATYFLFTMYRFVFLGKGNAVSEFSDLTLRERLYLLPLVLVLIGVGVYPKPLLDLVRPTVLSLLSVIQ